MNFIVMKRFFSFRKHFAYIDVKEFYANKIFIDKKIPVKFIGEPFTHPLYKYVVIFCSVPKGCERVFVDAMKELYNKMLLLGNTDYSKFCEMFNSWFLEKVSR